MVWTTVRRYYAEFIDNCLLYAKNKINRIVSFSVASTYAPNVLQSRKM